MKYLIVIIITLFALWHFGIINFDKSKVEQAVTKAAQKTVELAERGAKEAQKEIKKEATNE